MSDAVLTVPCRDTLPAFRAALEAGWSPTTIRVEEVRQEQLLRSAEDPDGFLRTLDDPDALGPPVVLPDGATVPRLPGITRWIMSAADGFCGSINLRWQHGTEALPPHVLGHIGYVVLPACRGRGHATAALRAMVAEAGARGLRWVDLTTDPENIASQRVIARCGGVLAERFRKDARYGDAEALRFRIVIGAGAGAGAGAVPEG